MNQQRLKFFLGGITAGIAVAAIGIYMYVRGEKPMTEFESITGPITYLADGDGSFHNPKQRYVEIEGYDKAFEIFIGMDPGDSALKVKK